jgi:hypothetical protein
VPVCQVVQFGRIHGGALGGVDIHLSPLRYRS